MRFLVTVLTNKGERHFAFDIYKSWPFFAFEWLDGSNKCWNCGEEQ